MKNGPYILVVAPDKYPGKKYRGRYCYEHHLVYWKKTKKAIPEGYTIHHKNGVKTDNRFSNLELLSKSEHASEHNPYRWLECKCDFCGENFKIKPSHYRSRKKTNKHGVFCSVSCGVKQQYKVGNHVAKNY